MVKDAELHATEDQQRREEIETRNTADTAAYQAEKMIKEYEGKYPAELKEEIEGKIAAVRSAMQGTDVAIIKSAVDDLNQSLQKLGQAMYGQQGGQTPPGGQPGGEAAARRQGPG